jgi:DNA polymerase-1
VGPKTAINLINTFGSVENILARWDEFKKLFPNADKNSLELSYWLVKLKPPEDLNIDIGELKRKEPNLSLLRKKLEELEMKSIIKDLDKIFAQKSLF